ncbi:hypothetical protein DPEC_G00049970 [Dallia pectoralis]|uniref:Uncharacterized protein n=1 Tax=Dallia pectoralis TaxID=75939 RepID=A0ACC2HC65_DALPE|nr:hypothetical protein DPEC_G00049970 [Dallia pectoralis]
MKCRYGTRMSTTKDNTSQHRKLLSFCGDILTFHCKRSAPMDSACRRGLELAFGRLTFNRDACGFSKGNFGIAVINKNSSSDFDIVACSYALHVKNRITAPCILLCMCVVSAEEVNGVFKSVLVAATSQKQLVYFENGIPKEMCKLPFEEPQHIQIVNTGRNGCLFAISFNGGHVCTVWKDTFQVALCWSGVSSLHVDDFVGCGTDQMLLVFRSQSTPASSLDHYLITDLCGTSYSQGQESAEGPNTADTAPENYLLTVQALQSRLQTGLTVLQDLQRDVSVKDRVLQQSLQALTDVVSGRQHTLTQTEQESLVSLWDEDEEEAMDTENQILTNVQPPLVEMLWHRVIEEHLIVGVILTAESAISVESVTLSILTEGGQSRVPVVMETRSRGSWFTPPRPSSPHSHPEPAAKRVRQDSSSGTVDTVTQRLSVTAVTDLTPLLTSGSVKCPVMLHYIQRQESSGTTTAPVPAVVQCGQVRVDIQAKPRSRLLDNSRLTTDEALEDLLTLLALLETWTFLIHSPGHTLCDVAGWIQRSMPCERLEIDPHYLLTNPAGPSVAMLFNWQQTTPFQGTLSVHCSKFQLLRFLDSLCVFLPASCSVLPLSEVAGKGASPRLALSLEKEVLSLKQGVSSLLWGEGVGEEGSKSGNGRMADPPDPSSADGLQRCREEWERSTQRSRRSMCPLVDVEHYRRLTQSLHHVQLEGDLAALIETSTHVSGSTL